MTVPVRKRFAEVRKGAVTLAAAASAPARDDGFYDSPISLKNLTPAYVAFCAYIFAIITTRVPIGTAAMATAILTLLMEPTKLRFPRVLMFAFALVAWAFVGYGTTNYPDEVADQTYEFIKVCAVVLVAVNVLTTRARLRLFLLGSMVAFFIYPARGTLQNYFMGETLQGRAIWNGIYANPNDLAALCLLQLGLVLGVIETERKKWVRSFAMLMGVLLPLIIVLSQSRGAFLAIAAFAGILAKRNWGLVKKKLPIVIAVCALIVIIAPDKAFRRFATIADGTDRSGGGKAQGFAVENSVGQAEDLDAGSAEQRVEIWKVARSIISENVITGVGLGAYAKTHNDYAQRPEFRGGSAIGARDTHSTYLNILAELGIVGFFCFMGIMYETVTAARASQTLARTVSPRLAVQLFYLEVGLYGFLVAGIWGSYGKLIPLYVTVATVYVAARLLREEIAERAARAVPRPTSPFARRGVPPALGRRG